MRMREIPFSQEDGTTEQQQTTRQHLRSYPPGSGDGLTHLDNPHYIPNAEQDAVMVTSIGNGRNTFISSKSNILVPETETERIKVFDSDSLRTTVRSKNPERRKNDDVYLLCWKS